MSSIKINPYAPYVTGAQKNFQSGMDINSLLLAQRSLTSMRDHCNYHDGSLQKYYKTLADSRVGSVETERTLKEYITTDKDTLRMLDKVRVVSLYDYPTLIVGPTGTGKDIIARSMHGYRLVDHFVAINCSALTSTLLESELFGHVQGAFTNATRTRAGKILAANCGTLFIDEVGDMSIEMQSKLLKFLDSQSYYPVGSDHLDKVYVRIVCATHKDLDSMCARGEFREDLYHRLSAVVIHTKGLVDRLDDIALIAKGAMGYEGDVRDLKGYPFVRGNVRELKNAILQQKLSEEFS